MKRMKLIGVEINRMELLTLFRVRDWWSKLAGIWDRDRRGASFAVWQFAAS